MPIVEQRQKIETLQRRLREYTVTHWVNDFLKQLEEIINQKREKAKSIEDILNDLERLFNEVEQAESLPQRMGFEDLGEFTIYQEIKNLKSGILPEDEAKALAFEVSKVIKSKRYTGWQESDQERRNTLAD